MDFADTLDDLLVKGDSRLIVGLMKEQQRLKSKKASSAKKQTLAQHSQLKAAQTKAATNTQKAPLTPTVNPKQRLNASQPPKQPPQQKPVPVVAKPAPSKSMVE